MIKIKEIRIKIARWLASEYFEEADNRVSQRVASTIAKMDPFEPILKEFHGVFSKEYERPEDKLDERSQINMKMWGYRMHTDPCFKYMTEWIMNTHANEILKHAPVTPERILYGRAQISTMILFVKEVGRLASLYEDLLEKNNEEVFNSEISAE